MTRVFRSFRDTLQNKTHALLLRGALLAAVALIVPGSAAVLFGSQPAKAQTPNTTVNFQARILTSTGALVPDGNYHIEFKLYDTVAAGASAQGACSLNSSTDDCWWLETRTTGNLVRVVNGYISVNLGSVTAMGSSIPWSQDLFITMRVGGSAGAASWDTEMVNLGNRMKLNTTPLALVSNNVRTANRTSAASDNITIQTGSTTTSGNSGNIVIDTGTAAGTTGTITLGATTQSGLTLGRSGALTTIAGSSILLNSATWQRTAVGTTNLDLVDGSNTTLSLINSGAGNLNLTVDGGVTVSAGLSVTETSTFTPTTTLTSVAGLTWNGVNIPATTATLTGTTAITTATGFNLFNLSAPTITNGSAVTVTNAATAYISGAPIQAGSATITNPYALWVDSGNSRFDGTIISTVASGGDALINNTSASGLVLAGVNGANTARLRIVANTNGWADAVTTSYFQVSNTTNNNLTVMVGLAVYGFINVTTACSPSAKGLVGKFCTPA